jgi:hypothetical protein
VWVYSGQSLERRLRLHPLLGFWIDYWLFLHSDFTHPIWCSRPLGLRAIAAAAKLSTGPRDGGLRFQLKLEIANLLPLLAHLPKIESPPAENFTVTTDPWRDEWRNWFDYVLANVEPTDTVQSLAAAIAGALFKGDLELVAYLSRRLSSELGEDEWSLREIFMLSKKAFCDSEDYDAGRCRLIYCRTPCSDFI